MNGIVMGGGVGVSAHGRYPVVTDSSRLAMPEVAIGFTPDVGGTWLLSRAPGQVGTHVALTAAHLNAGDAIGCGLADYYVPAPRWSELRAALAGVPAKYVLESFREEPPPGTLDRHRGWIEECYSADSVEEILSRLDACRDGAAAEAASKIRRHSPAALKVTLRALREAARLSTLELALRAEFRVMAATWHPSTLAQVNPGALDSYFQPLGDDDLVLDPPLLIESA
jgi:enoyl-CoA hydratase